MEFRLQNSWIELKNMLIKMKNIKNIIGQHLPQAHKV